MGLMRQFDTGGSMDWQQIAGWQAVTGHKLTPLEIEVIRANYDARNAPK